MKYLDQLPLSNDEKDLITALGTETPAALYGLILLTLDAFEDYFGKDRTWHLVRFLYPLLSESDRKLYSSSNEDDRSELFESKDRILKFKDQIKKLKTQ